LRYVIPIPPDALHDANCLFCAAFNFFAARILPATFGPYFVVRHVSVGVSTLTAETDEGTTGALSATSASAAMSRRARSPFPERARAHLL
jgi:hypothetical protein